MKTRNELLNQIKTELSNDYYLNQRDEYIVNDCVDKLLEAINYTRCCTDLKDKEPMTFRDYKKKHLEHNRIYDNNYEHVLYGWISVDSFISMYLKDISL